MGAEDTPLNRAIAKSWLVSAVARIYRPGCQVDTTIILEGVPGIRKSSVLRALAGDQYFVELGAYGLDSKDAMQDLRHKWIAEIPEFDGFTRAEQAAVKAFLSRRVDTYRPSYGRMSKNFQRQIVFAATTNKSKYLSDETGGTGRRTWPVWCTRGDVKLTMEIREQLWAEARARFESGEPWYITDPELIKAEAAAQDARYRPDPWESTVATWLSAPGRDTVGVSTSQVLEYALNVEVSRWTRADEMRVGSILRHLGWTHQTRATRDGVRVHLYRPHS
jgi:putative DNA primase/helicase